MYRHHSTYFEELSCRKHIKKAVRADLSHLALNAILTQRVSRKAGLGDASTSTGSVHGKGLAVSVSGIQLDPSNVAASCGNATNLPPGFGCSKCCLQDKECSACGAKEPHPNITASLAAVPALPAEDQCTPGMSQGIPAEDQRISTKDPGSTTEVKGICTKDQNVPANAQRNPSEGQGVLISQLAPAAVDCVVPATADDSIVAAGVELHQGGVLPSSAGPGIADWLFFEPLTDNLHWLPFKPQRSPCLAASWTPQISLLGCLLNPTKSLVWLLSTPTTPCIVLPLETHLASCMLDQGAPHIAIMLANWSSKSLT